jgi:hypothetical protein
MTSKIVTQKPLYFPFLKDIIIMKHLPSSRMSCCRLSPFVLFLLAIVLSVLLRYTDSDYPYGIFKLFLLFTFFRKEVNYYIPICDFNLTTGNPWFSSFLVNSKPLSLSIKEILIGTTSSGISYQLSDIYSICRCCWNVVRASDFIPGF